MDLDFSTFSLDSLIQAISIILAVVTFVVAQGVQKRRDRKLDDRDAYLQLEFAAIDLFRFEAEQMELIKPIWEEDAEIPKQGSAEFVVAMNYVCQMLNLFEIALRFRRNKILSSDIFATWVAWFNQLVSAPGFPVFWEEVRFDYLPDLRTIMDGGLKILQEEEDEDIANDNFYHHVGVTLDCKDSDNWKKGDDCQVPEKEVAPASSKKELTGTVEVKWVREDGDTKALAQLFVDNATIDYISHSEIQEGRAVNENSWSKDLLSHINTELQAASKNETFQAANIAAAYLDNKPVGYLLVEYADEGNGLFAILSDIVVDRTYQRHHVGTTLADWTLAQLRKEGIQSLYAESNLKNTAAHHFLEKQGMKAVSKVFRMEL